MNKGFFLFLSLISIINTAQSQRYYSISEDYEKDSSYYSISKINDSVWWVAGKNGVLSSVSNKQELEPVALCFNNKDILQIMNNNENIFIVGEGPTLCIINKDNLQYSFFDYNDFSKNGCFYDILILPDNKLLVCGGHHGVARAKRKIPRGFIGIIDLESPDKNLEITQQNTLKFFFALTISNNDNIIYASGYNGCFSQIYKSLDLGENWKKYKRVKGIIHDLMLDNNGKLWFSGTTGMRYTRNGMIGYIDDNRKIRKTLDNGCIWSMYETKNMILAVNNSGEIINICKESTDINVEKSIFNNSVYFIKSFKNGSYIFGGSGKQIGIKYTE